MINDAVTFLFTDIEGSTQLWEQHPEAMKTALAQHDATLRHSIKTHHGRVFKTVGDAFYAVFLSAPEALAAALTAQRALHAEAQNTASGLVIRVRMALHTGTAEERDGDYFGPPLNRIARLLSAAHGGQTLLSAAVDKLVRASLPQNASLRDMGERRLKDLTRPEHIYQLLVPDLPADFPPLKTLEGFRTNLPAQLTSFIGRGKEIAAVKQLIMPSLVQERGMARDGVRLVTLTGSGGAGKTRLSLQVASDLLDSFPDGVWFVEFAPLADPALVPQTVVTTLGLREETGHPALDILTEYLRTKTALLILDNCEHLVDASAQLVEALLQTCPNLHILVSSREALGVFGEVAYRVPSLSIPNTHLTPSFETITQSEAVHLFIDRAKTALPTFEITNENALAVAQICSRLDGIPLAIELAAARVKMLKVEQIAERLDDRFRLLTGGSRTALPRQQTLRALIDWSYDLLSESERALLRRLSVFAGGCTLEAAEQVCSSKDEENLQSSIFILHPSDVLDLLTQLVNKSLVVVDVDDAHTSTETRYRILETIRQYAREKLSDAGEGLDVRNRHLEYFLGLAERSELELTGPKQGLWLKQLRDELDNLRAALEWSLNQDAQTGLRLASALTRYWPVRNDVREGIDWLSQLLRQPAASTRNSVRAKALTALCSLNNEQLEGIRAEPFGKQGLALYRELGDQRGIALALRVLGGTLSIQGDFTAGRAFMFESLALYKTLDDNLGTSEVLNWLGSFVDNQDYARACVYLEESLALCRTLGHTAGIANRLFRLGQFEFQHGDDTSALPRLTEALQIQRDLGILSDMVETIQVLGELALLQEDYEQARVYFEESLSLTNEMGELPGNTWSIVKLGYSFLRQGDQARAHSLFVESQKRFKEAGSTIGVVYALEGLASLAVLQAQPERATWLFAWADATRETIRDTRPPVEQTDVDRDLATIHAQLDEAAFAAAQAAGRTMSMDEAISYAFESTHP